VVASAAAAVCGSTCRMFTATCYSNFKTGLKINEPAYIKIKKSPYV